MSVSFFEKALLRVALPIAALMALNVVGDSDFEAALASEAAYCNRLADGAHSDYLSIQEVCRERH